jgi:hypothetical protein
MLREMSISESVVGACTSSACWIASHKESPSAASTASLYELTPDERREASLARCLDPEAITLARRIFLPAGAGDEVDECAGRAFDVS